MFPSVPPPTMIPVEFVGAFSSFEMKIISFCSISFVPGNSSGSPKLVSKNFIYTCLAIGCS